MKAADPLTLPFAGLSLVESSAGTGKTTLLVRLYLRALLLEGLGLDRLLAVTYTRAATGELSVRIRRELEQTARQLREPDTRDDFRVELFERIGDDALAEKRIAAALAGYDDKAVFTIHGFCQRVLADNAFEAGAAFASEPNEDEEALRREVVADFWRRRVGRNSPLYVEWFVATFRAPDQLLHKTLRNALQVSGPLTVEPRASETASRKAEKAFNKAADKARATWQADRAALLEVLRKHEGLNGQSYTDASVATAIAGWEQWLAGAPAVNRPAKFELLGQSTLRKKTNNGNTPPEAPFFEAAQALREAIETLNELWWQEAVAGALDFVRGEARRRKRHSRELGFDDMLRNLNDALNAPGGKRLAQRIARQYPLILVDEFQDTDPLQHAIFTTIQAAADVGQGCGLILIGDPKQAIYRFRGADVFTYLDVRRTCEKNDRLYRLDRNYRSAEPLLAAVNTLFTRTDEPFGYKQIPYARVTTGCKPPIALLSMRDDDDAAATVIWDEMPEGVVLNKGEAESHAARICAGEIARLLASGRAGDARLADAPLQAGDMAVLVNDNHQGLLVQQALRSRGIASAMVATQSVFESDEAEALERVLAAVAEPTRGPLLRRALATELLGANATGLAAWDEDENAWSAIVDRFREYHESWQTQGFAVMFARLLEAEEIIQRTLARADGERALTNLRHLAELVGAESARRPGIAPLLVWLAGEREGKVREESRQIRLESDENLVRIATIHKAKGLQYPVVFLPFLWSGKIWQNNSNPAVLSHDEDYRAVLDLGSTAVGARREEAQREQDAENVRKAYVALTRAERACYIIGLAAKSCEKSALAKLLGAEKPSELHAALAAWVDAAGEAMHLRAPRIKASAKPGPERPHGEAREFPCPERLRQRFHVASYSRLVAGAHGGAAEQPERDEAVAAPPLEAPAEGIHAFPAGAVSGTFLHGLLEALPFDADEATLVATTRKELADHGFDVEQWLGPLTSWLTDALATPLGEPGCTLADIAEARRVNEMEFHFKLQHIEAGALDAAVADFAPRTARPSLRFDPLAGQMKGYIDLIFEHDGRYWVCDYKSNRLGSDLAAYTPEALDRAMAEHRYDLQYLLYTVALHRYLEQRLPGYDYAQHFGGVLYLFLRGMAPDAPAPRGIWHARPDSIALRRLDTLLTGGANA